MSRLTILPVLLLYSARRQDGNSLIFPLTLSTLLSIFHLSIQLYKYSQNSSTPHSSSSLTRALHLPSSPHLFSAAPELDTVQRSALTHLLFPPPGLHFTGITKRHPPHLPRSACITDPSGAHDGG